MSGAPQTKNGLEDLRVASFRVAISISCLISRTSLGCVQHQDASDELYSDVPYHGERGLEVSSVSTCLDGWVGG